MSRRIPMLDLVRLHRPLKRELLQAFEDILDGGRFIGGEVVDGFERDLAVHVEAESCVGMSSGTDALLATLTALGVGPGDEVITTGYSFAATAGSIARLGATPVFADIDPETFNIDPGAVEAAISPRTVGIVPVHLFGQCADMDPLLAIARRRDLFVVEDAAQSLGATYKGRQAGTMGTAGIFSFFPAKNLGALGDGGAVVTRDAALASRLRKIREHGAVAKHHHELIGGNFRLDALQAAMLAVKLPHMRAWEAARQRIADAYRTGLSGLDGIGVPPVRSMCHSVNNQFVIRSAFRDDIRRRLSSHDIASAVYYPVPLYRQPCFTPFVSRGRTLPGCDRAADTALALPMDPLLDVGDFSEIVAIIQAAAGRARPARKMA